MAIALSSKEWFRLESQAGRHPEDTHEGMRAYLRGLEEGSQKMTKQWPNSVENIQKRNEELRARRILKQQQSGEIFYKKYLEKEKLKQKQLMEKAKSFVFLDKDAPKRLLRAVIETVTLKERELQMRFNEHQNELKRQREQTDYKDLMEQVKNWHDTENKKKLRRREENNKNLECLIDQINTRNERRRTEEEEEHRLEFEDNQRAEEQMRTIKEFEEDFKMKERERIWQDTNQAMKERKAYLAELEQRERLDDKLRQVIQRANNTMKIRRHETELEQKNAKLRVLEAISKRLQTDDSGKKQREQEALEKAQLEIKAREDARHESDIKKLENDRKCRIEERKKFLEHQRQKEQEDRTLRNWSIANRFKNTELTEDLKQRQAEELWKRKMEYRAELFRLKRERDEREAAERAALLKFYGEDARANFKKSDAKMVKHARLLMKEAEDNGRPTYPIVKAMREYYSYHRLWPLPDLPRPLQAVFPEYRAADPPPDVSRPEGEQPQRTDGGERLPDVVPKRNGVDPKIKPKREPQVMVPERGFNGLQDKKEPGTAMHMFNVF